MMPDERCKLVCLIEGKLTAFILLMRAVLTSGASMRTFFEEKKVIEHKEIQFFQKLLLCVGKANVAFRDSFILCCAEHECLDLGEFYWRSMSIYVNRILDSCC